MHSIQNSFIKQTQRLQNKPLAPAHSRMPYRYDAKTVMERKWKVLYIGGLRPRARGILCIHTIWFWYPYIKGVKVWNVTSISAGCRLSCWRSDDPVGPNAECKSWRIVGRKRISVFQGLVALIHTVLNVRDREDICWWLASHSIQERYDMVDLESDCKAVALEICNLVSSAMKVKILWNLSCSLDVQSGLNTLFHGLEMLFWPETTDLKKRKMTSWSRFELVTHTYSCNVVAMALEIKCRGKRQ